MKPYRLSIIIPTWNTADITNNNVLKLHRYLLSFHPQIIVVDNASTDNTNTLLKKHSWLTLITNNQNLGFSQANNIGASKATGDYFLFLNSDIEIEDDSIYQMVKYLDQNSDVGLVGPQFLNPDGSLQPSVFPPQNPINAIKEFWLNIPSFSKYNPNSASPIAVWAVSGGAVLVRRHDFQNIGGWDESYFMYFEDLELCRQLRKIGKKIIFYPQSRLVHRHGASGHALLDDKNQWRRLIPSSIKYHAFLKHQLLHMIIWSGQKLNHLFSIK